MGLFKKPKAAEPTFFVSVEDDDIADIVDEQDDDDWLPLERLSAHVDFEDWLSVESERVWVFVTPKAQALDDLRDQRYGTMQIWDYLLEQAESSNAQLQDYWLRAAAQAGHPFAMMALAELRLELDHPDEAVRWLRRARYVSSDPRNAPADVHDWILESQHEILRDVEQALAGLREAGVDIEGDDLDLKDVGIRATHAYCQTCGRQLMFAAPPNVCLEQYHAQIPDRDRWQLRSSAEDDFEVRGQARLVRTGDEDFSPLTLEAIGRQALADEDTALADQAFRASALRGNWLAAWQLVALTGNEAGHWKEALRWARRATDLLQDERLTTPAFRQSPDLREAELTQATQLEQQIIDLEPDLIDDPRPHDVGPFSIRSYCGECGRPATHDGNQWSPCGCAYLPLSSLWSQTSEGQDSPSSEISTVVEPSESAREPKFCSECGTPRAPSSRFCSECGTRL